MGKPGLIASIHRRIEDDTHWLTRRKLLIAGLTLILVGLLLGMFESGEEAERPSRPEVIDIPLPSRQPAKPDSPDGGAPSASLPQQEEWTSVTVRSGQTLDSIFRAQRFSIPLLHRILAVNGDTRGLTRIRPGEVFDFQRDDEGRLLAMRYALDEARYLVVRRQGDELDAQVQQREIYREVAEAEGTIQSSLFLAGKRAGMSDAMIMKLANIFGWDIDFVLDIREGDRFLVVFEKVFREGEFLRDGDILAATFVNQNQRFQAIRFENGNSYEYFAPDGRNMRKAFLRAPLNFSYISSGFNPRRMHPVLKRIRPHNGIDYYAPRGTPVYAAGDGTVIRSDYSRANGHHVFIKHANSIETKYLHFTRRAVKQGQKVKQGQTIGYLHYEFVVNGVHRNPRTVPLPKVEPLKGALLAEFQARAAPMLTRLSRMEAASLYASRE
jgi:murein DD-endopeptidase MepM/ murein hydrolase activator NlpD